MTIRTLSKVIFIVLALIFSALLNYVFEALFDENLMFEDNLNSGKTIYLFIVERSPLSYRPFKSHFALKQPTQSYSTSSIPR